VLGETNGCPPKKKMGRCKVGMVLLRPFRPKSFGTERAAIAWANGPLIKRGSQCSDIQLFFELEEVKRRQAEACPTYIL